MKRILLSITLLTFLSTSFAQTQIDNNGFEGAWQTGGDIQGTEPEPEDWSSLKSADALAALAPTVAFQETTDPHTGTYCIRLQVVNSFGVNATGTLTNGRVHADFNPENGYVWTETGDAQYYQTFTDRPDSLVVWIKHDPQNSDKSKVEILLHEDPPQGQLPPAGSYPETHWVGKARVDIVPQITTWQRFSVPFNYYNTNTPDYVLAVLAGGDSTIAEENTMLWVDDIELIYNPLTTTVSPGTQQTVDICTNGTMLTVQEDSNAAVVTAPTREWKWSNTMGGPYNSFTVAETGMTYTPNFSTVNTFYIVCETDYGSQGIVTSNEVEIVTNDPGGSAISIIPVTTQNINANQSGTALSTQQCPTADSLEWMWTTTSGSGYQSFIPGETGATYTPLFATAGTYYVICEGYYSGTPEMSNEVTIVVADEGTGIDEFGTKINLFKVDNHVQLTFESTANQGTLEIFSLDGKKVYDAFIKNGVSTHQVDHSNGIYIYRILVEDKIFTGKIKL